MRSDVGSTQYLVGAQRFLVFLIVQPEYRGDSALIVQSFTHSFSHDLFHTLYAWHHGGCGNTAHIDPAPMERPI